MALGRARPPPAAPALSPPPRSTQRRRDPFRSTDGRRAYANGRIARRRRRAGSDGRAAAACAAPGGDARPSRRSCSLSGSRRSERRTVAAPQSPPESLRQTGWAAQARASPARSLPPRGRRPQAPWPAAAVGAEDSGSASVRAPRRAFLSESSHRRAAARPRGSRRASRGALCWCPMPVQHQVPPYRAVRRHDDPQQRTQRGPGRRDLRNRPPSPSRAVSGFSFILLTGLVLVLT